MVNLKVIDGKLLLLDFESLLSNSLLLLLYVFRQILSLFLFLVNVHEDLI